MKFFCLVMFITLSAQAEYRAFELEILNTKTQKSRKVASTLDHIQYPDYYPVLQDEVVLYKNSWMCFGRTDYYTPTCPNPRLEMSITPLKPKTQIP